MNFKQSYFEFVAVVRIYRNGEERRESMPRWLAELCIGCIASEEPNVARARIERVQINEQAPYPVTSVTVARAHRLALQMAEYLPTLLVA